MRQQFLKDPDAASRGLIAICSVQELEARLIQTERSLQILKSERKENVAMIAANDLQWLEAVNGNISRLADRIFETRQELNRLREARRSIASSIEAVNTVAPTSGRIQELVFREIGLKSSGEPIMTIVPIESGIVFWSRVNNSDAAFIELGDSKY